MGLKQLHSRAANPRTSDKLARYHRTFKEFYVDHVLADTVDEP